MGPESSNIGYLEPLGFAAFRPKSSRPYGAQALPSGGDGNVQEATKEQRGTQDFRAGGLLNSQVAGNNGPLYPKVDHYWFKVAHNYTPLALQAHAYIAQDAQEAPGQAHQKVVVQLHDWSALGEGFVVQRRVRRLYQLAGVSRLMMVPSRYTCRHLPVRMQKLRLRVAPFLTKGGPTQSQTSKRSSGVLSRSEAVRAFLGPKLYSKMYLVKGARHARAGNLN